VFATDSAYAKSVSFSNFESNIIADHLAFSCAITDAYTREMFSFRLHLFCRKCVPIDYVMTAHI
jgi:hypothetical protein